MLHTPCYINKPNLTKVHIIKNNINSTNNSGWLSPQAHKNPVIPLHIAR